MNVHPDKPGLQVTRVKCIRPGPSQASALQTGSDIVRHVFTKHTWPGIVIPPAGQFSLIVVARVTLILKLELVWPSTVPFTVHLRTLPTALMVSSVPAGIVALRAPL